MPSKPHLVRPSDTLAAPPAELSTSCWFPLEKTAWSLQVRRLGLEIAANHQATFDKLSTNKVTTSPPVQLEHFFLPTYLHSFLRLQTVRIPPSPAINSSQSQDWTSSISPYYYSLTLGQLQPRRAHIKTLDQYADL